MLPFLRAADVMLCDTSSIAFEFLLLHKPVVTFRNWKPGPHLIDVQDEERVGGALERALEYPSDLVKSITKFAHARCIPTGMVASATA